jgi:hypothetical protein
MTLIIAYILMAHVGAHWLWYPVVFIAWLVHIGVMSPPSLSDLKNVAGRIVR